LMDTREFGDKASEEGVHIPKKTGSRYPEEFKAATVQLARSSPEKSTRQVSYELGIADLMQLGQTGRDRPRRAGRPHHPSTRGAKEAKKREQDPPRREGDPEKVAAFFARQDENR
jgi:transposase-like protein